MPKTPISGPMERVHLRLPTSILDALRESAARNQRSLNSEVTYALRLYLEQPRRTASARLQQADSEAKV